MNYPTYRLKNRSQKFGSTISNNICKTSNRLTARMNSHIFDPFDPISTTMFLYNFNLECDVSGIPEGAAIWLINFFVKKLASSVFLTQLALKHKTQTRKPSSGTTMTLTTYQQIVNYLLSTYKTDKNIAHTMNEITMFTQTPNKSPSQYEEELESKGLQCED